MFPDGISLTECQSGECVDKFAEPVDSASETLAIDSSGIAGLTLLGAFLLALLSMILYGFFQRRQLRSSPRMEEAQGMLIKFENISYTIKQHKILNGISGEVGKGQVLAIMGPSGSGKSTLLDILARKNKTGVIRGQLSFDGKQDISENEFKSLSGFVDQEDAHISCLTVREVLEFSANLRLSENISHDEKMARVGEVIEQLGLESVADSRIGDTAKRGISGGEKRRLSIGVELVSNPSILFLDEPSSGLDSHFALQVIRTVCLLASKYKKTVVFTIHQPNSSIFALLDNVLLLSKGNIAYFGPASNAESFCQESGYPCPKEHHIADHLLEYAIDRQEKISISSVVLVEKEEDGIRKRRVNVENSAETVIKSESSLTSGSTILSSRKSSLLTQLQQVISRSLKVFWRSPSTFISHVSISVVLGIFVGFLYYRINASLAGIQNRLGSIFFMQSVLGFAGLSAIAVLHKDRTLFLRERSNGYYGYFPYFVSKVTFFNVDFVRLGTITNAAGSFAFCPGLFFDWI